MIFFASSSAFSAQLFTCYIFLKQKILWFYDVPVSCVFCYPSASRNYNRSTIVPLEIFK